MVIELKRFSVPLTIRQLPAALRDSSSIESESLGMSADFDEVQSVFETFHSEHGDEATERVRARLDWELAVPLHKALTGLSRRNATDMQFWHWLCICQFQDIVWYRWYGHMPTDFSGVISTSLAERFAGSSTLHGISRNTFARLWWCAESLHSNEDGYDLVRIALSSQDFFQAIFERKFSLCVPVAKACLMTLEDHSEDDRREATKELNHYFTTIVAEALSEQDVVRNLLNKYIRQS